MAAEYRSVLEELGVGISYHKSLISTTGALEFAKRFLVKNVSKDLSPVSVKAVMGGSFASTAVVPHSFLFFRSFLNFRREGVQGHREESHVVYKEGETRPSNL